ncbi:MAG: hypothetical protein QW303_00820 [Nitrososphaerota archaeon]
MKIETIVFVLLVIILYIIFFVRKNDPSIYEPIYDYNDLRDKFRTGDIIFFSCQKSDSLYNMIEYYFRTNFVGSQFGHVGLVVRDERNELYVLECTKHHHCADRHANWLNERGLGGIRIINMDILIRKYHRRNNAIFGVRFISREIPVTLVRNVLNRYRDVTFESKSWLYLLGIIDICFSHRIAENLLVLANKKKMMCSEFVHHFLHQCGVLGYYPSKLFWPHLFNDNRMMEELEIVKYSKLFKFTLQLTSETETCPDSEKNNNKTQKNNQN